MNGATSGVKAGTALSSKDERGHDAAGIARTSIVEDARLYPETTGKRMGQIVRFELDEQETPAPQTQVQLPASSPINLTDEEERMSRDSNAEIRQKAHQVLESLMRGNERFRKGVFERCQPDLELMEELVEEQSPSAVVLACSDSRCPPEMVFDQGLGDLFVVRVAGNVVNDFVLGSIMSAVHVYGVRLIVVLGHTRCGMVARAIQHWAKHEHKKALDGVGASSSQPSKLSALSSQSPFAQMAQQDQKKPDAAGRLKKPGLLGRLCACGREPEAQADEDPSARGQPLEEKSRSNSTGSTVGRRSSIGRAGIERMSVNPISAIVGGIQSAVDHVAGGGEHNLRHIISKINKHQEMDDLGATGLRSQDSLGITRARLAKQRLNESTALLDDIKNMEGVEEVSTQNTVLNAKAVLKGLVKCTDKAVIQEVEVVAAKYDLATGVVKVVKKGWFSGKSFYYQ
ncbi:hypothetical protein CVIRNUC_009762 [Coccomyxa viridis]|uniref:carbonic anhydrase n=1 Tax=Coccomyxa viridis TaxID=1274662 RepID=A0AAV1IHI3_9CHLO|nr:hypothetical protein CVIRNUC_009762 [Coccomyxa viridis]